ncbi:MAG: SUMF1/EgtB/PvdO family nonheme iron enzyme [Phycisphaeraceae bacterium]|nr:SUMF1/EgtB/PvdO family nonheme iron enzyme [Phycisphaeraceae bacterium]
MHSALLVSFALVSTASARDLRVTVEHGYEFVTIGAPGNRAYEGYPFGPNLMGAGQGRVDYEYRIARTEVSTGDWLEFRNTNSHLADNPQFFATVNGWGAQTTTTTGQWRLTPGLANAERTPVGITSWISAAMYCNWLHNGKEVSAQALLTGAYNLAGAGYTVDSPRVVGSPVPREQDAKFFIPTRDEWKKAVYFDPDAEDPAFPGQGRWWLFPNQGDDLLVPGYPGQKGAETSAYLTGPPPEGSPTANYIPLGSYPQTMTPWGLLDASGATSEWLDHWDSVRYFSAGSSYGGSGPDQVDDQVWNTADTGFRGLRIAAAVPAPGVCATLSLYTIIMTRRRR